MNKRSVGAAYEKKAASYLIKQGYKILEYNYRCRMGEIDLICREAGYLVFTEVKYRTDSSRGNALEAVNEKKQRVIRKVAQHYLMMHHLPENTPCRFDVVGITGTEIVLIRNGF